MNKTTRRAFLGGGAATAIAGVAAFPFISEVSSQEANPLGAFGDEIDTQLKDAIEKMRNGLGDGAKQAATTLRLLSSTIDEKQLQAALRKANRRAATSSTLNHGEMVKRAKKLGLDPSTLPPHSLDRVKNEAAFDKLTKEGLGVSIKRGAELLDKLAEKIDDTAKRAGGAQVLAISMRQPIPNQTDCGDCNDLASAVEYMAGVAAVVCAIAEVFPIPPNAAACAAAMASFFVFFAALAICLGIAALCRAFYN